MAWSWRAIKQDLKNRRDIDLFYSDRMMSDTTFVEQPVPVYPSWKKQPDHGQEFDAAVLKGFHFTDESSKTVDRIAIGGLIAVFAIMALVSLL